MKQVSNVGAILIRWLKCHEKIVALLIFLVAGLISLSWFDEGRLLWGVDAGLPIKLSKLIGEYYYLFTWKVAFSAPDASKFAFLMPLGFVMKLWDMAGLSYSPILFEQFLILILFSASGFSGYYLFKTFFPSSITITRIMAGLLYMFSIYSLVIWHTLCWIIIFYALFPLVFGLYVKGINQAKDYLYFLKLAVIWTVLLTLSYVTPPFMLLSWMIIIFYLFYHICLNNFDWRKIKRPMFNTISLFIGWLALNLFWLVPQMQFFQSEFTRRSIPVDAWGLIRLNSVSAVQMVRFLGPDFFASGYKGSSYYPWFERYGTPLFIIIGISMTFWVFINLFLVRRKKKQENANTLFLVLLLLIFIALLISPVSPMQDASRIFYSQFKLAELFRSTWQRFMPIVSISYSLLIALALDSVFKRFNIQTKVRWLLSVVLIMAYIGIYAFPVWRDHIFPPRNGILPSQKIKIPQGYYDLASWLDEQPNNFNVLPIPYFKPGVTPLLWNNGDDGYLGAYPMIFLSNKRFIIGDLGKDTFTEKLTNIMEGSGDAGEFLNYYNIRYVILHRDTNWAFIKGHNWYLVDSPDQAENVLRDLTNLSLEKQYGDLAVYRNTQWRPNHIDVKGGGDPFVKVKKLSPVHYEVLITNLSSEADLILKEAKNKGFRLSLAEYEKNWPCQTEDLVADSLTQECSTMEKGSLRKELLLLRDKGPVIDSSQMKDKEYLNKWKLDPQTIKDKYSSQYYKARENGAVDIKLVLHFSPQYNLYLGILLSAIAFMLVGIVILISRVRKSKRVNITREPLKKETK